MSEHHPQFWFTAADVAPEFSRDGETRIACWLQEQLSGAGYQAAAPQAVSWGQRIRVEAAHTVFVDCAAARLITDSPSAPPCWIAEVVYDEGISSLEGKAASLPTVARVGRFLETVLSARTQAWRY